ncbi:MAG: hypothetical protein FXF47_09135 [Candidatus Mcinerneyibacterium aminivorans]|uniref:Metalloprotease TldD/E C-terminal domain-containing protein n=1 Tax=Candidatus Mcinerneyibacterium aminivorans TaxID=2703815 RepID=A0A5D0MEY4_9BACT|nr:MAG: hypothetical protein FXF47_09135 [Candidatus Mcinerneyibacterium aminivorans]
MDKRKRFQKVVNIVNKNTKADDYIINYEAKQNALTRFANNMVTQNVDTLNEQINLTLYFDKKKASLSTANLEEESIKKLIKKCEKIAQNSVVDKEYMSSLKDDSQKIKNMVDEKVVDINAENRADIVNSTIQNANKEKVDVFGTASNTLNSFGVATKNGMFKFYENTNVGYSNTVQIEDEKGASFLSGYDRDTVSIENVNSSFTSALRDSRRLQDRKEFEPGRYKVVLSAQAATKLFLWLGFYGNNRRAVDEGYSPYVGKMNKKIMDKRINIYTDPVSKKAPSKPFTEEGLGIEKKHMIKEGKLVDIPCSRFWADKNDYTPWSMSNIIISDGDKSEEDLIKQVDKGFYIKDLWYIRMVKMEDFTLTGMTRNGFFYIEDGKIKTGATHFRWNDSPIRMLNNLIDMGKGTANMNSWYSVFAPSLLIDDFYLSSKTLF